MMSVVAVEEVRNPTCGWTYAAIVFFLGPAAPFLGTAAESFGLFPGSSVPRPCRPPSSSSLTADVVPTLRFLTGVGAPPAVAPDPPPAPPPISAPARARVRLPGRVGGR